MRGRYGSCCVCGKTPDFSAEKLGVLVLCECALNVDNDIKFLSPVKTSHHKIRGTYKVFPVGISSVAIAGNVIVGGISILTVSLKLLQQLLCMEMASLA